MKKLLIFLMIFSFFNLNQMYWDKVKEDEKKVSEKLLFDISDFITDHYKELKRNKIKYDGVRWTTINRIHPSIDNSYPLRLKAGITYITYTYTTGENVKVCWLKDRNNSHTKIKRGNKIIYYFTPDETGNYHWMVTSTGAKSGMQTSFTIKILN